MDNSFSEIVKSEFLRDPTDPTFASAYFDELNEAAQTALDAGDSETYWELSRQRKVVGKMLPLSDERNPDNPIYSRRQGSNPVE